MKELKEFLENYLVYCPKGYCMHHLKKSDINNIIKLVKKLRKQKLKEKI